jgi:hypothetical protein
VFYTASIDIDSSDRSDLWCYVYIGVFTQILIINLVKSNHFYCCSTGNIARIDLKYQIFFSGSTLLMPLPMVRDRVMRNKHTNTAGIVQHQVDGACVDNASATEN